MKNKTYIKNTLEDGIVSYDCKKCGESFLEVDFAERHDEKHKTEDGRK